MLAACKVLAAGSLVGLGVWYYLKYQPLTLRAVEIYGADRFVNRTDVQQMAEEKALGKNIVFVDVDDIHKAITSNFLASRSVTLTKVLPNRLRITVSERVPIALILPQAGSAGDNFYFVDAEGFILGPADKATTNLPVINYSQKVEVGKFVEAGAVSYYFELIKALDEDNVALSTISSYPRYTEFFTGDATQVLFSNAENPKPQIKVYAKLMEAFKAEGKKLKKIDLRFDKVIVEFVN